MIAIHKNKLFEIQGHFKNEIEKHRLKALVNLKAINKKQFNQKEKDYLIFVITLFEDLNLNIITSLPSVILNLVASANSVPPNSRRFANGKAKKSLKKFIIEALNYSYLRKTFYPKYFKELGIKSCVYCNSQLAITVYQLSTNKYSSKFDVDHYHSKDEYPFLSISLCNLYPVCSSCNRKKSNNVIEFELYTDNSLNTRQSVYSFKIDPYAKAKYLTTKDSNTINFKFEEPPLVNHISKSLKETFQVKEIYETQLDVIEELIIKSQIYNESYIRLLKNNFNKLALNNELFKRTLVGNYTMEKDIHKRPLSKFMMDIARELELIK